MSLKILMMSAVSIVSMSVALPAFAQEEGSSAGNERVQQYREKMKERYENASPEEKAKMEEARAKWESMSDEEKKQAMQERREKMKERYENATPEQKAKMQEAREKWKNASDEDKAAFKEKRQEHADTAKEKRGAFQEKVRSRGDGGAAKTAE